LIIQGKATEMKRYFCRLSFLWIILAMPLAASTSRIYVLAIDKDTIDVIDPLTNNVVQTIRGVPKPLQAAFSPDGSRAYITSETSEHNLYVVDTKTGETITKVLLSGRPCMPAITVDGKRIFVTIEDPGPPMPIADDPLQYHHWDNRNRVSVNGGAVDIVDATTLNVVKTIPMRGPGGGAMHDIFLSPDGKYMLAGCCEMHPGGDFLAAIDVQTEKVVWEVPFDYDVETFAIEAGPDGSSSRVFVETPNLHGFIVVDFATHKQVAKIIFPNKPSGFYFSGAPPTKIKDETHGSAISPDGKTLWINNHESNVVFVYSLPALKLLGYVPVTQAKEVAGHPISSIPSWITFTADGSTAYVSCDNADSVDAIDARTMKKVATIPVEKGFKFDATLVLP
jgi:DNA-binding beta-propeller fold protein YncE